MGTPKTPKAPDPNKSYQEGIDVYLRYLPTLLNAEQSARDTYDNPSIEADLARQNQYGPRLISDALARLNQVDPTGQSVRSNLGQSVTAGLASGTGLPDDFRAAMTSFQGAAAGARGGSAGSAAPEDVFKGGDALAFYNARLGNAQKFLAGPTPEQQIQFLPSVQPDRGADYVNMNAGYQGQQFALQNYQNVLASSNPNDPANMNAWQRAINGARIGAQQGGTYGGGWGALGGALGGAGHGALNTPDYQWNANNAYHGG